MITRIGSAPRHTSTVTTTVKATLSRRRSRHGAKPSWRSPADRPRSAYSDRVTEDHSRDRAAQDRVARPEGPRGLAAFMRTGWGDRELDLPPHPVADLAAARRARLAETFPGERLVLPAGTFKVRSNDTDYRFRPDTAHTYFSGNQTSDAVLVVDRRTARSRCSTRGRARRARPTSSSATGSTASCGPAAARRSNEMADVARPRGPPHRRAAAPSTAGKTRCTGSPTDDERSADGIRACLGDAAGQGRVGGRRAPGGLRHHHARLRGLGRASGTGCSSTASAGSRAPSSAAPARWATTSATTRSSAAASTPRRCTGSTTPARSPRASWCCSTWASRAATSTPPT